MSSSAASTSAPTTTPASPYALIHSILNCNKPTEQLAALVGSLGKGEDLATEIYTLFTNFVETTKINQSQHDEGTSLAAQLESSHSLYTKLEADLAIEQRRFDDALTTLKTIHDHKVSAPPTHKSAKIEVHEFDGKDFSGLDSFLFNLNAKFNNNGNEFANEQAKLVFYASHLTGAAHTAIRHVLNTDGTVKLDKCEEITQILETAFSHANAKQLATAAVKKADQAKQTFSIFVAKFLSEVYKSDLTEPEQIREFRRAVNPVLFRAIIQSSRVKPLPNTLAEYVALARVEDLILSEINAQVTSHQHSQHNASSSGPFTAAATTSNGGDAMDVSQLDLTQLTNGRLNPVEKQRRIDAKLCLYDGEDHPTASCPKLAAKEKRIRDQSMANFTKAYLLEMAALKE